MLPNGGELRIELDIKELETRFAEISEKLGTSMAEAIEAAAQSMLAFGTLASKLPVSLDERERPDRPRKKKTARVELAPTRRAIDFSGAFR